MPEKSEPLTLIIVVTRIGCRRGASNDEFMIHWAVPPDGGTELKNIDSHLFKLDGVPYHLLLVHGHRDLVIGNQLAALLKGDSLAGTETRGRIGGYASAILFRHPQAPAGSLDDVVSSANALIYSDPNSSAVIKGGDYTSQGSRDPAHGFLEELRKHNAIVNPADLCRAIEDACLKPIPQIVNGLHEILDLLLTLRLCMDLESAAQSTFAASPATRASTSGSAKACFLQIRSILEKPAFRRRFVGGTPLEKAFLKGKNGNHGSRKTWTRSVVTGRDIPFGCDYVKDLGALSAAAWDMLQGLEVLDDRQEGA